MVFGHTKNTNGYRITWSHKFCLGYSLYHQVLFTHVLVTKYTRLSFPGSQEQRFIIISSLCFGYTKYIPNDIEKIQRYEIWMNPRLIS